MRGSGSAERGELRLSELALSVDSWRNQIIIQVHARVPRLPKSNKKKRKKGNGERVNKFGGLESGEED